jgi:hypothetical protein
VDADDEGMLLSLCGVSHALDLLSNPFGFASVDDCPRQNVTQQVTGPGPVELFAECIRHARCNRTPVTDAEELCESLS